MDNAQILTVTVEATADVDPQAVVDAINEFTADREDGYPISWTEPYAVAGEPYVPATSIRVGRVTLVK